MISIVITLIISVTALGITALLCFKGITFHKKMSIDPTGSHTPAPPRTQEMDEIEKRINQANAINQQTPPIIPHPPTSGPTEIPTSYGAMDAALKVIQDVFGPDPVPPSESNTPGGNV